MISEEVFMDIIAMHRKGLSVRKISCSLDIYKG